MPITLRRTIFVKYVCTTPEVSCHLSFTKQSKENAPGSNQSSFQECPKPRSTFLTEVQRGPAPRACAGAAPPAAVGLGVDGSAEAVVAPAAGAGPAPRVRAAVQGPAAGAGAAPGRRAGVAVPVVAAGAAAAVAPGAAGARAAAGEGARVAPRAPGAGAPSPGTGAGAAPAARGARGGAAGAGAGAAGGARRGAAGAGAGAAPPGAHGRFPLLGRAQGQVIHELRHVVRSPRASSLGALSSRLGFGRCSAVPGLCSCGVRRNSAFMGTKAFPLQQQTR